MAILVDSYIIQTLFIESIIIRICQFWKYENFHLLHFAVHQTNDREYISDFFCIQIFFAISNQIENFAYKSQIFKFKMQQKVLNKKGIR